MKSTRKSKQHRDHGALMNTTICILVKIVTMNMASDRHRAQLCSYDSVVRTRSVPMNG